MPYWPTIRPPRTPAPRNHPPPHPVLAPPQIGTPVAQTAADTAGGEAPKGPPATARRAWTEAHYSKTVAAEAPAPAAPSLPLRNWWPCVVFPPATPYCLSYSQYYAHTAIRSRRFFHNGAARAFSARTVGPIPGRFVWLPSPDGCISRLWPPAGPGRHALRSEHWHLFVLVMPSFGKSDCGHWRHTTARRAEWRRPWRSALRLCR